MIEIKEDDFDQIYELMKLSFIKDELRTYEEQKSLLKESIFHIYAERDKRTRLLKGFIAFWTFDTFNFVDYLAVHPSARNTGLGGKMLRELIQMSKHEICLEIETPIDELTQRRQHFYEKNGFILCTIPYVQPPISKGNDLVPLSLMCTKAILDINEFEHYQKEIYKHAYERFV